MPLAGKNWISWNNNPFYNNGGAPFGGMVGGAYMPPQYQLPPWMPPSVNMGWTPVQHITHGNMQLPPSLQITGREGDEARATAHARFMRNQGTPAIAAEAAANAAPAGGYNSFHQAAVRDTQVAMNQAANEYADEAKSRAIQDKIALHNAMLGTPTPMMPTNPMQSPNAYAERYMPNRGGATGRGAGMMSMMRGLYNLAAPSVQQHGLLPAAARLPGQVGGLIFGRGQRQF